MRKWLQAVGGWLRSFPTAVHVVTIRGHVLDGGGEIHVGPGVHLIVEGNVQVPRGKNWAITAASAACVTVNGNIQG